MTSNIPLFNKLWIIGAVVLVLAVQLIITRVYPNPAVGIDYHWKNEINSEKPDIILIGSSPLRRDVGVHDLVDDLESLMYKNYRVFSIFEPHSGACYWQLILKNQVCPTQNQHFAVGIFTTENKLTGRDNIYTDGFRNEMTLGQLNYYDEPLHYRKHFPESKESPLRHFLYRCKLYSLRKTISSDLFKFFVKNMSHAVLPSVNIRAILDTRFNGDVFNPDFYLTSSKKFDPIYDFDKTINGSFLPDIVALKNDYNLNLFVVVLPVKAVESAATHKSARIYYEKLKNYLESNGVSCISFFDTKEFNNSDFRDLTHLKSQDRLTNMLAEELINRGIIK